MKDHGKGASECANRGLRGVAWNIGDSIRLNRHNYFVAENGWCVKAAKPGAEFLRSKIRLRTLYSTDFSAVLSGNSPICVQTA